MAEILYLDAEDPEADIALYMNSPGGLSYAVAIYDVMQHVNCDVSTICVGMGMSAAAHRPPRSSWSRPDRRRDHSAGGYEKVTTLSENSLIRARIRS